MAPLLLNTPTIVLQHPHEAKRKLQTVALLDLCLDKSCFALVRGRGTSSLRQAALWDDAVVRDGRKPLLLFPRDGAMRLGELRESVRTGTRYCIVALDGTWKEANDLLRRSSADLDGMASVDIGAAPGSEPLQGLFAARKPPQEGFVSTIEAVAYALGALEADASAGTAVTESLLRPMIRMAQQQCDLTAQHGRQVHRVDKPGYRPHLVDDVRRAARALGVVDDVHGVAVAG
eukprot:1268914-Prymnesium_polylepis.1